MFSLNDQLLYQLQKKYHQDLIREAEKERLIRYALSVRVKHASSYKRTICWMEHRLIAWGEQTNQGFLSHAKRSLCFYAQSGEIEEWMLSGREICTDLCRAQLFGPGRAVRLR